MDKSKTIIIGTLLVGASWLVYFYNPKLEFDTSPDTRAYQISLENIDINLADTYLWQGNFKAQSTKYLEKGLVFEHITGLFKQNEHSLTITADKGFWPHNEHQLYLYDNIKISDFQTDFEAEQLIVDLKEGTLISPTPVTWRYGNITAVSPLLEEKVNTIKNSFWKEK